MNSKTIVEESLVNHLSKIRAVVYKVSQNKNIVDDITQECCVHIIERERLWNGNKDTLPKWLSAIARNFTRTKMAKWNRDRSRMKQENLDVVLTPSPEDEIHFSERDVEWVLQEFIKLSEKQRKVLYMRYYEGMKMVEIAEALNITQPTVTRIVQTGIARLQKKARMQDLFSLLCPWKWSFKAIWNCIVFNKVTETVSILVALVLFAGVGKWMLESASFSGIQAKNHQVEKLELEILPKSSVSIVGVDGEFEGGLGLSGFEKEKKNTETTVVELRNALISLEIAKGSKETNLELLLKFKELSRKELESLIDLEVELKVVNLGKGLSYLKYLSSLTLLDLEKIKITDTDLKELSSLKNLTNLNLGSTAITDVGLKELSSLKNLTNLDLGSTAITDVGLKELRSLKSLTNLGLWKTKITDEGLKELRSLKYLTQLSLWGTKITDECLKDLSLMKSLVDLNLGSTAITGVGLKQLSSLKFLTDLSLWGMTITDAGLKELGSLKSLKNLSLWKAKVSDKGLKELKKALPECFIGYVAP